VLRLHHMVSRLRAIALGQYFLWGGRPAVVIKQEINLFMLLVQTLRVEWQKLLDATKLHLALLEIQLVEFLL